MDAEIKIKNKLSVLSALLDDRRDLYGVKNTIAYLLDQGLTKEEILDLRFDEDDVDYVIENPDEDYDCEQKEVGKMNELAANELAKAIKKEIRSNLLEKKKGALRERDECVLYHDTAENEGLKYLYGMKLNQIVGYIDALDDLLEELE